MRLCDTWLYRLLIFAPLLTLSVLVLDILGSWWQNIKFAQELFAMKNKKKTFIAKTDTL